MQNMNFQIDQLYRLFSHHINTLGGIQRPISPPAMQGGRMTPPSQVATDDTGQTSGAGVFTRFATAVLKTPGRLFGVQQQRGVQQ